MLSNIAFTPNSPLLLQSINKENYHRVEDSVAALQALEEELYIANPDTILIISEHPTMYPDAFSITISDPYSFDLKEFGDFSFQKKIKPDIGLMNFLQEHARGTDHPVTLTTDEALHFASAVPLAHLTKNLVNTKVVPVSFATELSPKQHFHFGLAIKEAVLESNKKIAIIASGDLSHTLTADSPATYHPSGKEFDQKIQDIILHKNTAGLLNMPSSLREEALQNAYFPLCILFGILDGLQYSPEILNYEAPFGVGFLTAAFHLK